jgi:hypothetical protein
MIGIAHEDYGIEVAIAIQINEGVLEHRPLFLPRIRMHGFDQKNRLVSSMATRTDSLKP